MSRRVFFVTLVLALATSFAAAEPTIFLARHAEKAEGGADPKNPELSDAGRTRAESLARMLKNAGVSAIFATEYKRTQQTAEAIGRATGAEVTVVSAKDTPALVEKLKARDGNAVVIGHSNTLPEIIKTLGVEKPVQIPETDYDNLFIWHGSAPREIVRLHF